MSLSQKFNIIIEYLKINPSENLSGNFGKIITKPYSIEDIETIKNRLKEKFEHSRQPMPPTFPKTLPDELVSFVIEKYYSIDAKDSPRIQKEHQMSMSAENIVGELLERYLSSVLEPFGWIWCSGDFVKAVDFLKKDGDSWKLLQIKNRSNTENSSSNKIRKGTSIEKWYRIDAYTGETFWATFPDESARHLLSEDKFKEFIKTYLAQFGV